MTEEEGQNLFGFDALVIAPMDLAPALAEMVKRITDCDPAFINEAMSAWLFVRTGQNINKRRNDK